MEENTSLLVEALKESIELLREDISRHRETNRRLRAVNSMLRKQIEILMLTAEDNDAHFQCACQEDFIAPVDANVKGGLPATSHQVEPLV